MDVLPLDKSLIVRVQSPGLRSARSPPTEIVCSSLKAPWFGANKSHGWLLLADQTIDPLPALCILNGRIEFEPTLAAPRSIVRSSTTRCGGRVGPELSMCRDVLAV